MASTKKSNLTKTDMREAAAAIAYSDREQRVLRQAAEQACVFRRIGQEHIYELRTFDDDDVVAVGSLDEVEAWLAADEAGWQELVAGEPSLHDATA